VLDEVHTQAARDWVPTPMTVVPPFHDVDGFIESWSAVAGPVLAQAHADHVLLSFHSIPQRHLTKSDSTGAHCLVANECCDHASSPVAAGCYRAQCIRTAQRIADTLDLAPQEWSISFQSRLGRIPWVEPYTDRELTRLREQGVRRLAVLCPAFVCDNLETLEEIGIRARRQWLEAGGEELVLVPSLNSNERWVQTVVDLVRERAGSEPQAFGLH
jgi:ferrochelatase